MNNALAAINQGQANYRLALDIPAAMVIQSGGVVSADTPNDGGVTLSALTGVQNGQLLSTGTAIQINILGSNYPYGIGEAASSSPRIDLVCVQYTTVATDDAVRTFEQTVGGVTSTYSKTVALTQADSFAVLVVHGTPATNPAPPATPSGWFALAQVYVPANATAITSSNITDVSSSYRTDGGRLALVSAGVLTWIDTTTIGIGSGSQFQFGTATVGQVGGQLQIQGGSSAWTNLPWQLAYNGLGLLLQPSETLASGTAVMAIQSPSGSTVGSWDAQGNLVGATGTFQNGLTGSGSLGSLTAGPGILGGANVWTALQTFQNAVTISASGTTATWTVALDASTGNLNWTYAG